MRIEEKTLQYWIDHFYGYGSWHADIWFVGFEDGGGEWPEEVAEKINYFYTTYSPNKEAMLCNIRDLYRQVTARLDGPRASLFKNLYDHRFGSQAIQHGVWKNLIAFVHGFRNETLPDVLMYQKNLFASPDTHEAWIQLYPLPSPHNHAWYYSWLDLPQLEFIRNRTHYQQHVYPARIQQLLQKIQEHKPKVVMMYAMENINALKESIHEFFSGATFKIFKAIKHHIPQHHLSTINGTKLILTTQMPALRHNRIETGFDWYEFGRLVNG